MRKLSTAALAVALTMSTVNMTIPAHAKEGSVTALATNFAEAKDVALDKRWTITFNKAVSKNADLEKLVYVEDSHKNKVPVEISINTARTKIYVEPINQYVSGETYELIIHQALSSESGKKLKDTVVKKFTTVDAPVTNTDFEATYSFKNEDAVHETYILVGETTGDVVYRIEEVDGGQRSGVAYSGSDVYLNSGEKIYMSYTKAPTTLPSDYFEKNKRHIETVPALQKYTLPINATATITAGESLKRISNIFVYNKEEDTYLPIEADSELTVETMSKDDVHKLDIAPGKMMRFSNVSTKPLQFYALPQAFTSVKIDNTPMESVYIMQPGESVKAVPHESLKNKSDGIITFSSFDNRIVYDGIHYEQMSEDEDQDQSKYVQFDNEDEKRTMDSTYIENSYNKESYYKNLNHIPLAIFAPELDFSFIKSNEQISKTYVLQPNETIKWQFDGSYEIEIERSEVEQPYRVTNYNRYNGSISAVETNIVNTNEEYDTNENILLQYTSQLTNLSNRQMIVKVPYRAVTSYDVIEPTITVLKPGEKLKLTTSHPENYEGGHYYTYDSYVNAFGEEGKYTVIYNQQNGNQSVATKRDEAVGTYYQHQSEEVYSEEDKVQYIQNTGDTDLQFLGYDKNVSIEKVQTFPTFNFDEEAIYTLKPGEKWKVENVDPSMANLFTIEDPKQGYLWDFIDFNIYNSDGSQGYTGGMGGDSFFRGSVQEDGYLLIENTSTYLTANLVMSKLFMKISKQ